MPWPKCIIIYRPGGMSGLRRIGEGMEELVPAVRAESTPDTLQSILGPHVVGIAWQAPAEQEAEVRETLRRTGLPAVRLYHPEPDPFCPVLDYDHYAEGRAGAAHLLEQGYRQFAFVTHSAEYTRDTEHGFADAVTAAGCTPARLPDPVADNEKKQHLLERLTHWLAGLNTPVGVMAPLDYVNIRMLEACYELNLQVPHDVALLGAGDEELCREMETGLSSVRPGHHELGRTAARMLLRMARGAEVPRGRTLIPPDGIAVRGSSIRLPDDPLAARVMRYLLTTPVDRIDCEEMWDRLPASRRTVQRRFKAATGRTVRQEMRRLRVERARRLLRHTDLPLADIAVRTGYEYVASLSRAFKAETGTTPGAYREET